MSNIYIYIYNSLVGVITIR